MMSDPISWTSWLPRWCYQYSLITLLKNLLLCMATEAVEQPKNGHHPAPLGYHGKPHVHCFQATQAHECGFISTSALKEDMANPCKPIGQKSTQLLGSWDFKLLGHRASVQEGCTWALKREENSLSRVDQQTSSVWFHQIPTLVGDFSLSCCLDLSSP